MTDNLILNSKYKHVELKDYQPTDYVQYDIYNIVIKAFIPYRGMELVSKVLTHEAFMLNMQYLQYIHIEAKKGDQKYIISILDRKDKDSDTNEIASITEKFKLFINTIKAKDTEILIISPCKFQTHVINYIHEEKMEHLIHRYMYDHFKDVKPLAPGANQHYILDEDDAEEVIKYFNMQRKKMRTIFTDDPQVIWLGAMPGQIIYIKRINQISGFGTDYRRVVRAASSD